MFHIARIKQRAHSSREAGFTLLELLIVVLVVLVVTAIAVPVYLGVQEQAYHSVVQSDVNATVKKVQVGLTGGKTLNEVLANPDAYTYVSGKGERVIIGYGSCSNPNSNFSVTGIIRRDWSQVPNTDGKNPTTAGGANYIYGYDSETGYSSGGTFDASNLAPVVNTCDSGGGVYGNPNPPGGNPTTSPTPTPSPSATQPSPADTCPAQPDDTQVVLAAGDLIDNLPANHFSTQRFLGESGIELDSGQRDVFNNQVGTMQGALTWYKNFAAANASATVDQAWITQVQDAAGNAGYYFGSSDYSYGNGADQPESDSNAIYKIRVYDFGNGYSFDMYLGETNSVRDFTATWNYDVSYVDLQTQNADVHAVKAIMNTDGYQTTGYQRQVTPLSGSAYNQYAPACGQTQRFGTGGVPTGAGHPPGTPADPNNPGPDDQDPAPNPDPADPNNPGPVLTLNNSWHYAFDGPTAEDTTRYYTAHGSDGGDGVWEYPGMCDDLTADQFPGDSPANLEYHKQACRLGTGDGTPYGQYGMQMITDQVLQGTAFGNTQEIQIASGLHSLDGYYTCKANDPVHAHRFYLLNNYMYMNDTSGYPIGGGGYGADGNDFWTVTTYVQCDTTAKIAQARITVTRPVDPTRYGWDPYNGHMVIDGDYDVYFSFVNETFGDQMRQSRRVPFVENTPYNR